MSSNSNVVSMRNWEASARRQRLNRWSSWPDTAARAAGQGSSTGVVRQMDDFRATPPAGKATTRELAARLVSAAGFLRRRITGDYDVDELGFDPHLNDALVRPLLRLFFRSWFRVEVSGIHHLPVDGAALVMANHGGVLPLDALMTSVAVRDEHPTGRELRLMADDLCFALPGIGKLARKAGHSRACPTDSARLLASGELLAVFPEGNKGLGKGFKHRYQLQPFDCGRIISTAVATKAPIVPCSILGCEEAYPMLADVKPLARLLGLPYFPVTPLFPLAGPAGLVPLPSKWRITFGAPIDTTSFGPADVDNPQVVSELAEQVVNTIQQTLRYLMTHRRNIIFG